MKIKKFKNGNFNVRREDGDTPSLLEAICDSAELDFLPANEEDGLVPVCLGNSMHGYELYNTNTNMNYVVTGKDEETWRRYFTVKLYGVSVRNDEGMSINEDEAC